jgi:hypothetical protein
MRHRFDTPGLASSRSARFFNQASAHSTCAASGTLAADAGADFAGRPSLVRAVFMGTEFYSGQLAASLARSLHEVRRGG